MIAMLQALLVPVRWWTRRPAKPLRTWGRHGGQMPPRSRVPLPVKPPNPGVYSKHTDRRPK